MKKKSVVVVSSWDRIMCRCFIIFVILTLLFLSSSQVEQSQSSSSIDGTYLSIARTSQVTVTTVKGGVVDGSYARDMFGSSERKLRPTCTWCPNTYNYLVAKATGEVVIPDTNGLHFVSMEGSYKDTISLPNCEPFDLGIEDFDNFTIFVQCTPEGTRVALYEVNITARTAVLLSTFVSDVQLVSGSAVRFFRDGFHYVYLARRDGAAYASTADGIVVRYPLVNCDDEILRITDSSAAFPNSVLFECGNTTSGEVRAARRCSTETPGCHNVPFPPRRRLGVLRFSPNGGAVLASVAADRIDVVVLHGPEAGHVVDPISAVGQQVFRDAYIEAQADSAHVLVYADLEGKVHRFDISAALGGQDDVVPREIPGDYTTCADCSGLVRIGTGFCAVGTSEGVAWLSVATPPSLIETKAGFDSQRFVFLPADSSIKPTSERIEVNPDTSTTPVEGIIGGVVAFVAVVAAVVVLSVVVAVVFRKRIKRHRGVIREAVRFRPNNEDSDSMLFGGLTPSIRSGDEIVLNVPSRTLPGPGDIRNDNEDPDTPAPVQCTEDLLDNTEKAIVICDTKLSTLHPCMTLKSSLAQKMKEAEV